MHQLHEKSDYDWERVVKNELPAQVPPSMIKADNTFDLVIR